MKRIFKVIVALCLFMGLCACSSEDTTDTDTTDTTETKEYNVSVYSSNNVEIVLNSIASDSLSFDVTNKTSDSIGIDCYYVTLDGITTDYFYGEDYYSELESIASNDTYEVVLDNSISNTDCKTFSAVFGVWEGESGDLIEFTNISKTTINEDSTATFYSVADDSTQIYDSDTVTIYVDDLESDTMVFDITNNTDDVISIDCDYIQLGDTTYKSEDLAWGAPILEIASGDTLQYTYIDSSDIIDINIDSGTISGIFNVWEPVSGYEIEKTNISDVSLN